MCSERAKKRAVKAAVKRAKQAFHTGVDSWTRSLHSDDQGGSGGGGGFGGGSGGAPRVLTV